jgi:hypothetical protein
MALLVLPVGVARAADAPQTAPSACLAPIAATDRPGPVFRNARLAIADTPAGTAFALSGCVQNNGPAGSVAGYLINALVFDRAGNLLVSTSAETNPVAASSPPTGDADPPPTLQTWSMTPNAGYPVAHAQVRPTVLLIVYSRACPDAAPGNCAKPYDIGPVYILLSPCLTDGGRIVATGENACPAAAPEPVTQEAPAPPPEAEAKPVPAVRPAAAPPRPRRPPPARPRGERAASP